MGIHLASIIGEGLKKVLVLHLKNSGIASVHLIKSANWLQERIVQPEDKIKLQHAMQWDWTGSIRER